MGTENKNLMGDLLQLLLIDRIQCSVPLDQKLGHTPALQFDICISKYLVISLTVFIVFSPCFPCLFGSCWHSGMGNDFVFDGNWTASVRPLDTLVMTHSGFFEGPCSLTPTVVVGFYDKEYTYLVSWFWRRLAWQKLLVQNFPL